VVMGTDYHDAVSGRLGAESTQSFYRMYLVPGMAHCAGGYGPNLIDGMTPLIEWVEGGKVPQRLRARLVDAAGTTRYDRAYCPYPQRTVLNGGDPEKAENWRCDEPPQAASESSGCSVGKGRDASLPLLLAGSAWALWWRRRAARRPS
jgi:hypothetical protein